MKLKELYGLFRKSLNDLIRRPALILPGVFVFAFILGFSKFASWFVRRFQTSPENILWVALSTVILLLMGSFVGSGWIGICRESVEKKKFKSFFGNARKFWFRNFLVLILFVALFNVINLILFGFTKLMLWLPTVGVGLFRILSFLIAFIVLASFIIFFSFSNFYVVLRNLSVPDAVRASFKLVRKEYLATLSICVLFFVVTVLISFASGVSAMVIGDLVILPMVFLVYTRFVIENDIRR